MRTYSVTLYEEKRNRRCTFTAESFSYRDGILRIYHRTLGNVNVVVLQSEELTITQDEDEDEEERY